MTNHSDPPLTPTRKRLLRAIANGGRAYFSCASGECLRMDGTGQRVTRTSLRALQMAGLIVSWDDMSSVAATYSGIVRLVREHPLGGEDAATEAVASLPITHDEHPHDADFYAWTAISQVLRQAGHGAHRLSLVVPAGSLEEIMRAAGPDFDFHLVEGVKDGSTDLLDMLAWAAADHAEGVLTVRTTTLGAPDRVRTWSLTDGRLHAMGADKAAEADHDPR